MVLLGLVHGSRVSRVAVVGGGPGGLALAASLARLPSGVDEVCVFEAREVLSSRVGGGLQLSGGAKVCELLGELSALRERSEGFLRVLGRNKDRKTLLDLEIGEAVRNSKESGLQAAADGEPLLYTVMRSSLQELLFEACQKPGNTKISVKSQSKVVEISKRKGKYTLAFSDGLETEDFDLVFGCDGVNSAVRDYIFAGSPSAERISALYPKYSGIRVGYMITEPDRDFRLRPAGRGAFHQWFGDGIYVMEASYGSTAGPQHMLIIVYRDANDATFGVNAGWSEASLKSQLQGRIERGGLDRIEEISKLSSAAERTIDVGVREAILPLPRWSSEDGRVVLMGDSAHAM